eukprot:gene18373-24071_t
MLSQKLRILLSALLIVIPSIIRRKITRFDIGAFILVATSFSLLDTAKSFVKEWINKVKSISDSFSRHSTPITKKYFFKNENAADRVTLLGVFVNILLSISKFTGGIVCHSAVLVADAGHSLSDLLSDFITLWAVQVARLPADDDHPYGHGKFESIGSLFLSLTLLFAGLSVGSWSYDKFVHIISALKFKNSFSSAAITASKTFEVLEVPTWPALVLAGISIASKEWLYRITKRVDAFSSVLSLVSIAFTMLLPQYVFVDAIAGILIAVKAKAYELRNENKSELLKSLEEYKKELSTLRVAQVSGGAANKLGQIKVVRKNIARVLTVINQKSKEKLREKYVSEKYIPKDLRAKKTRAIRRRLTKEQLNKKTLKQQKKDAAFPKRVYAVKAL